MAQPFEDLQLILELQVPAVIAAVVVVVSTVVKWCALYSIL
jgi:sensor domain CHASE-containing protein